MTDHVDPPARDSDGQDRRDQAHSEQDKRGQLARVTGNLAGTVPYLDSVVQLIHAQDSESTQLAQLIKTQCDGAGIEARLTAIKDVRLGTLHSYTALAVILTRAARLGSPSEASMLADIVRVYRDYRPDGLKAVLDSQVEWYRAGVVQIVFIGAEHEARHPAFTVLNEACRRLFVPDSGAKALGVVGNLFDLYAPTPAPYDPQQAVIDGVLDQWRLLRKWGVSSPGDVPAIRAIIAKQLERYSNKDVFAKLAEPWPGATENRLQMVLENPTLVLPPKHNTGKNSDEIRNNRNLFQGDGARACRLTLKLIKQSFPSIARPPVSDPRYLMVDFRDFAAALRSVDILGPEVGEQLANLS